jgi:hypothetical protein
MGLFRVGLIGAMGFALVLHSGCSFLFVNGPPENHAGLATFECSESKGWPTFDAIWAALNGIGAASAFADNENPDQGQIVAVGLAWLAVSGASAVYGYSKVSDCHKAKRARDERYSGRGVAGPATAAAIPPPREATPQNTGAPAAVPERAAVPSAGSPMPAGPPRSLAMRPAARERTPGQAEAR